NYSNCCVFFGAENINGPNPQIRDAQNGDFTLSPTSPAINGILDEQAYVKRTPGASGTGVKHGAGGDIPFANNWQTWNNGAWQAITTTSYPVMTDGSTIMLASAAIRGIARSAPV